ncbi:MAG: hypothetical protein ACKO2P_06205, partial [Planctomycetota bacterium]
SLLTSLHTAPACVLLPADCRPAAQQRVSLLTSHFAIRHLQLQNVIWCVWGLRFLTGAARWGVLRHGTDGTYETDETHGLRDETGVSSWRLVEVSTAR